jgi:hypothetical protein
MGFAHHCVYLTFYSHMISEIRQYPKVTVTAVPEKRLSLVFGESTNRPMSPVPFRDTLPFAKVSPADNWPIH